jgi:hypothetical protein
MSKTDEATGRVAKEKVLEFCFVFQWVTGRKRHSTARGAASGGIVARSML